LGDSSFAIEALVSVVLNKRKIRVLIIDDHAGMREGISAVVNAQPDMMVVGEAGALMRQHLCQLQKGCLLRIMLER